MKKHLSIDPTIFEIYPETVIGYMVVDNLHRVANIKINQEVKGIAMKSIHEDRITMQNLVLHPTISEWRKVYENCGVKPKTFKSSVESLLKRFLQSDYKEIIPTVDLYNYISAGFIVPIGGYDFDAIEGSMCLRLADIDDTFIPLSGKDILALSSKHIVYADESVDENIICWMWNQKDSKKTMLLDTSQKGLFIFDCILSQDITRVIGAQKILGQEFFKSGVTVVSQGLLDKSNLSVKL